MGLTSFHQEADREVVVRFNEREKGVPDIGHAGTVEGDSGVEDHKTGDRGGVLHRKSQADGASPVLNDNRRSRQVE